MSIIIMLSKDGGAVMSKQGRPVEENSMKKVVTVRMTDEEHEKLTKYAQKSSKTLTQVIKEGIEKMYKQDPIA